MALSGTLAARRFGETRRGRWLGRHQAILTAYLIAVTMFGVVSLFKPGFASVPQIRFMLLQASFIGIVALGQTFVVIAGGIDLSIPAVLASAGVLLTQWSSGAGDANLWWVIPLVYALAAAVGLLSGVGISILGISPIVMTLGMNVVVAGAVLVYTGGGTAASNAPPFIVSLATKRLGGIPAGLFVWLVLALVATLVLSYTAFGRRVYAVGTHSMVSFFSGVNVKRVQIATYVISAVSAVTAGILLTGFLGQSYPAMGDPFLFASVAAVAVGGASVLGGNGHYLGTVAGALILTILGALLPILNLKQGWLQIIYGAVILATVGLTMLRTWEVEE